MGQGLACPSQELSQSLPACAAVLVCNIGIADPCKTRVCGAQTPPRWSTAESPVEWKYFQHQSRQQLRPESPELIIKEHKTSPT